MVWRCCWRVAVFAIGLIAGVTNGQEPKTSELDAALREKCLSVLWTGVMSDEFWPALHAAEALTLAGHGAEVLKALAARNGRDDQERCGLAREAVRAGDRSKIAELLSILCDRNSNGRIHAAESLFKVAEVGDGSELRTALADGPETRLKLMAAAALARGGHPTALDTVRSHVADSDPDCRKVSIWILGQLGAASDIAAIAKALAAESDALTRAFCIDALACLGDKQARQQLGENLGSDLPAVRTFAAEFAGYCRTHEFRGELIKLLDHDTLDVRVRAAQSLIALSLPPEQLGLPIAVSQQIIRRDVFPATKDNPRYSEGSVAAIRDGSLLYATTEFIGGGADHATAHIVARTSVDRGQTWNEPRVLQENTGKQNVMSVTLRRLMPGRFDGPLGMFYLIKNSPSDLQVWLRVSENEGRTFAEPIRVTDEGGYHVMNNDRVTVLSSGRLSCPVAWTDDVFKTGAGHFVSFCYLSDDQGKTWRRSAEQVDQPRRGAMEPEVVELEGGKLLMIIRTQLGRIATSLSNDGGDHWSSPGELSVPSPESPATIRRIPSTGDLLLIWNNTSAVAGGLSGKRTPLTAAISSDGGQTWTHQRNIEERPDEGYAYTSVTFHRDRALLTYYVANLKTGQISSRFSSLPVNWLYATP
jgi:sialidase-1